MDILRWIFEAEECLLCLFIGSGKAKCTVYHPIFFLLNINGRVSKKYKRRSQMILCSFSKSDM